MATTGTAIWPGATTLPGSGTIPGQGQFPFARCRLSFDNVSDPTPNWSEVTPAKFRSFSISRGRQTEFEEFDAGTAQLVLDNRDRAYDPTLNASVRPLNRVWLYAEHAGVVYDLFYGYVDSWEIDWPGGGWSDAIATANCVDEFMVLSMMALPVTNPPRESYTDLVMADGPNGYWDMNESPQERTRVASVETPSQSVPIGLRTAEEWPTKRHDRRRNLLRGRRKR